MKRLKNIMMMIIITVNIHRIILGQDGFTGDSTRHLKEVNTTSSQFSH